MCLVLKGLKGPEVNKDLTSSRDEASATNNDNNINQNCSHNPITKGQFHPALLKIFE